ncbi:hypothetical protein, partial [Nonomuraea basaltis]|uniref:hypothetical protein n=1 Tax=Nonomuraea basaltis TaxID=2495887 RepID=UPI0014866B3B
PAPPTRNTLPAVDRTPAPANGTGDALTLLRAVETRISEAEQRATDAEKERDGAIAERDHALGLLADTIEERDAALTELGQINTLFKTITGGRL